MTSPLSKISSGLLYLCLPAMEAIETFVASCIEGGVDIVQLREKDADAKVIIETAKRVSRVCQDLGVPFILNDRIDLALEVGADGVHLGQDDAPIDLARRILPKNSLVGLSTHSPVELERGNTEAVDYLSVGPIVPTPTKPGRPGTTIEYLKYATKFSMKPFFVTGGVTPESIPQLVDNGASGLVVVRYLTQSSDPKRSARELREALDRSIARRLDTTDSDVED